MHAKEKYYWYVKCIEEVKSFEVFVHLEFFVHPEAGSVQRRESIRNPQGVTSQ